MSSDNIEALSLFYDLFSIEIVENKMECLDVSSVVSGQLLKAGISHRVAYGSVQINAVEPAIVLAPHYYIEVMYGDSIILIDPSLAFWLEDEIENGLCLPFVFDGYCGAKKNGVCYSFFEEAVACEVICSDLLSLIDNYPLPLSALEQ